MKLVVISIAALASPALADEPKGTARWCTDHGGDNLVFDKSGGVSRDGETHTIRWRGRLNSDRREDVILDEGACGTRECMLAGYVACADGTYAEVFREYAARVRVKAQKRGWGLLQIEHVGDTDGRGERRRNWATLRFGRNGND